MTRPGWWSKIRSAAAIVSLAFLATFASAQHVTIPEEHRDEVIAISERTIEGGKARANAYLDAAGFTLAHQQAVLGWEHLTSQDKLATAFLAFEDAKRGSGERFLSSVAHKVADRQDTMKQDARMKRLFAMPPSSLPVPRSPTRASNVAAIPSRLHRPLAAIAYHISLGATIPAQELIEQMGHTPSHAIKLMRESASLEEALWRAVSDNADDATRTQRMKTMVATLEVRTPSSRHDRRLDRYRDPTTPRPAPPPPYMLGADTFAERPGPPLDPRTPRSKGIGGALRSKAFTDDMGGVAFAGEAKPAATAQAGALSIRYDESAPDGRRVIATAGGIDYSLRMPDWIAIPAAAWSAQEGVEAVSAMGRGDVAPNSCMIDIRYAPAIEGTMVAMRLLQADGLPIAAGYADVFRRNGAHIHAPDETVPDAATVAAKTERHRALLARLPDDWHGMLTDEGVTFSFGFGLGRVWISGSPHYQLMRRTPPDENAIRRRVGRLGAAAMSRRATVVEEALESFLAKQVIKPDPSGDALEPATLEEIKSAIDERADVTRDRRRSLAERREALTILEVLYATFVGARPLEKVPAVDNPFADVDDVDDLNPLVWRATRDFARAAAFFRFIRSRHAAVWRQFARQLPPVSSIMPRVDLPICWTQAGGPQP